MATELPFSQACENNKAPILKRLRTIFGDPALVLEIGTGTGQHAVHFAQALPHLKWQPSDRPGSAHLSRQRLEQAALPNILPFIELDVGQPSWPVSDIDGAFSANTAHIMAWPEVERMFHGVAERLPSGGVFCLYGPFNDQGRYSSESNLQFDRHLQAQAPHMGIRDLADLDNLAATVGLSRAENLEMPANNRLVVWTVNDRF